MNRLLLALCVLMAAGCAGTPQPVPLDDRRARPFAPHLPPFAGGGAGEGPNYGELNDAHRSGDTSVHPRPCRHYRQVINQLGMPTRSMQLPDGSVLMEWDYRETRTLYLPGPPGPLMLPGVFIPRTSGEVVQLAFDAKGCQQ